MDPGISHFALLRMAPLFRHEQNRGEYPIQVLSILSGY